MYARTSDFAAVFHQYIKVEDSQAKAIINPYLILDM